VQTYGLREGKKIEEAGHNITCMHCRHTFWNKVGKNNKGRPGKQSKVKKEGEENSLIWIMMNMSRINHIMCGITSFRFRF
jgi:hypothetical protein